MNFLFETNEITTIWILVWLIAIGSIAYYVGKDIAITSEKKKNDQQKLELERKEKNLLAIENRNRNLLVNLYNERQKNENLSATRVERYKKMLEEAADETKQNSPWLASQVADVFKLYDMEVSRALKKKKHPALKASEEVAAIAKEKRYLQAENKMLQYQIAYYETLFPWLEEFKEVPARNGWEYAHELEVNTESEYELLKKWLSPEEYQELTTAEKYQLALDRYNNRKKSDWDAGIEYERYVGYIYERLGAKVQYTGAKKGLEDMGRDLLVTGKDSVRVIQCKRWSKTKTIHEKHIFQLFGTTTLLRVNNPMNEYIGTFVTTTSLSDTARACAKELKIEVVENYPIKPYPMIKCHNSSYGKIYHLPMDQQYDRVQINESAGSMFAWTVKEAEEHGFRRAYRWNPKHTK